MAWDGARRLGEAQSPSTARYDDGVSSSMALAVGSGRASSRMGWRRLSLLWVVKGRRVACLATRCRRARFFLADDDIAVSARKRPTSAGSHALCCFMIHAIPRTGEPPRSVRFLPLRPPMSMSQLQHRMVRSTLSSFCTALFYSNHCHTLSILSAPVPRVTSCRCSSVSADTRTPVCTAVHNNA